MRLKKEETAKYKQIKLNLIQSNPNKIRRSFDQEAMIRLTDSIRQFGVIEPIVVRKVGSHYEIVCGERRFQAAKMISLEKMPCIVRNDIKKEKILIFSLVENMHREKTDDFEFAGAVNELTKKYCVVQSRVASLLSSDYFSIINKLKILRFSAGERRLILKNNLSHKHLSALLRVRGDETRIFLLSKVIKNKLSAEETEKLVESFLKRPYNISTDVFFSEDEPPFPFYDSAPLSSDNALFEKTLKKEAPPIRKMIYKDTRFFINSLDRTVESIKNNEKLEIDAEKNENEKYIEYKIKLKKEA